MTARPANDFTPADFGQPGQTRRLTDRELRHEHRLQQWVNRSTAATIRQFAAKSAHLSLSPVAAQTSQGPRRALVADDGDQESGDDDDDDGVPEHVLDSVALVVRRALARVGVAA